MNVMDAQRTKLLEEMGVWARANGITLTRAIYFEKSMMDEIAKLKFIPGAATAYFEMLRKGCPSLSYSHDGGMKRLILGQRSRP
jgi:hypothetical protein